MTILLEMVDSEVTSYLISTCSATLVKFSTAGDHGSGGREEPVLGYGSMVCVPLEMRVGTVVCDYIIVYTHCQVIT